MSYPYIPLVDCDSIAYSASGSVKEGEPVNYALQNAKKSMESIQDKFDRGLEMKVYLTGTGNFREQIAVTQPYKGNRTAPKPLYLPDVRQYLIDMWGAVVIDGKEADDAVCIQYLKDPEHQCIVSIDKDLDQVPGYHYNYRKDLFYTVSEAEGELAFYLQLLMGDRTDHIKGIPGIGKAKAPRLLEGCRSSRDMYEVCKQQYALAYPGNWEEVLNEHADLLFMWRKEDDKWQPPSSR